MDATPHIIESALLLLLAFLLGCIVGFFARRLWGAASPSPQAVKTPLEADPPAPSSEAALSVESATETPESKAPKSGRKASASGSRQTVRKQKAAPVEVTATTDDLKKIRGIGPRLEAALNAKGITRYAQIAKWSKKAIAEIDAELALRGRIDREQWVDQAKSLSKVNK